MTKKAFSANIETCDRFKCKIKKMCWKLLFYKKNLRCFSGCLSQGKVPTCSKAIYFEQNESDSEYADRS